VDFPVELDKPELCKQYSTVLRCGVTVTTESRIIVPVRDKREKAVAQIPTAQLTSLVDVMKMVVKAYI
jgi:hypothetical protein